MWGALWTSAALVLGGGPPSDSAALRPGQPAPSWEALAGTDGAKHALADFRGKTAVVVVFFANSCPDSLEYEDRLIALANDYAARSVAFVLINVCLQPADTLPKMAARAGRKKYPFPYLLDPSQKTGVAYTAGVTPTVFVLDKARKVVYRGAVDDDYKPERVQRRYLREALDALLAGRPVKTPETEPHGCDIEYE